MKRFSTGIILGIIVGLILATAAWGLAASQIKLVINGQEVACDVPPQNINGRVLVPARFVAEGLGATVEWDEKTQSVNITSSKNTVTEAVNVETGSIKGTITYQYNEFIGSRGDTGAYVFLLNKNANPGSINFNPHSGLEGSLTSQIESDAYWLKVDGYGHYEANIPAGEYVIVIQSKGAQALTGYVDPKFESLVKPLFDDSFELFEYGCTVLWKHTVDTITIKPNTTLDYSYDFGYSM